MTPPPRSAARRLGRALLLLAPLALLGAGQDWPEYNGGPDRSHYSTLRQITRENVSRLRPAWEYHSGDFGILECNPIVVGKVLYALTAKNGAFALDAATGREIWRYHPGENEWAHAVRGVTYWADGGDRRIFLTAGPWLIALDARTGQPIASFGAGGKVDLHIGLGPQAAHRPLSSSTPGTLFENLIVMPLWTSEDTTASPGFIQAFDVRTGKLVWTFHTIPQPGEPGYGTWPKEAYKNTDVGSANCWAGMAVDRKRGIIYAGTGSAAPDFWGGKRLGDDLYANCVLALDARTGKHLWHFQVVHHDLWDRDMPAPPNLLTVHRHGRDIDAVAQVTKAGLVFVFDRVTGEPLFPIRELPAPPSNIPGERTSPTQPMPELPAPFTAQKIGPGDINPWSQNHDALVALARKAHSGFFEPLGDFDTLVMPGYSGGAEWGGAATDPRGTLYVNANNWAYFCHLRKSPSPEELAHLSTGHRLYDIYCIACHGLDRTGTPVSGVPELQHIAQRRTPEDVMKQILHGSGRMPGFTDLSENERRAITDFLFGIEKQQGNQAGAESSAPIGPPAAYTPYTLDGYRHFVDQNGYFANKPPWGTLTAIDLNTGRQRWQVPLGEYKELKAKGVPPTGTENWGGPVVTASGLIFMAGTMDREIRAFDSATGQVLWEASLPAGGFATPCTYEAGGRQYVVIGCGGDREYPAVPGDSYVAFALP